MLNKLANNKKRWVPPVLILVLLFVLLVFFGQGDLTDTSIYKTF